MPSLPIKIFFSDDKQVIFFIWPNYRNAHECVAAIVYGSLPSHMNFPAHYIWLL